MTRPGDLARTDAVELACRISGGELDPMEVVACCLESIERTEPPLGAFVHVDAEGALERARGATGPLGGVPFAVKDAVAYPGMRWAMGSRLMAGNVAAEHSPYTRSLDRAGLVTVGKTATSELALLGSTETLLDGQTRNPWGEGLSAAGSSGGAAAAVAAGLLPVAHAADGGGSIRVPASVCGVFGFKPSNGRTRATAPDGSGLASLVVDHVVSRTVRDSALMLSVTERIAPGAPYRSIGFVRRHPGARRLRIAAWRPTLTGRRPDPEVDASLTDTMRLCAALGHEVEEIDAPAVDGAAVSQAFFTLAGQAVDQLARMVAPVLGRDPGPEELEPFTVELLAWYRQLRPSTVESAWADLHRAAGAYLTVFEHADAALTPTLAALPWPLGHLAPTLGRVELIERTEAVVGYSPIHNLAGCPAMSVPLAWSDHGLPIGMQLAAAPGGDALLLGLAYELEGARPWRDRRPGNLSDLVPDGDQPATGGVSGPPGRAA